MHVVVNTTLHHPGRQGTSVDDFLYRGYDMSQFQHPEGTGIRGLAAEFIRSGKMLARYVYLIDDGDTLRSINIYRSEEAYREMCEHPTTIAANNMWSDREWERTITIERCTALIDIGELYQCHE